MSPKISVVVCAHNEEKYIGICLRSLLSQSVHEEFEVIVVDDASSDNTIDAIEPFLADNRIRLISSPVREGIGATANKGIAASRGRFIVRVDADDFVSEAYLELLLSALIEMRDTRIRAVRCDYRLVDQNGQLKEAVNSEDFPVACGILWEKEAMIEAGLYDSMKRVNEDLDFEQRFSEKFDIFRIPIPMYRYRVHPGNTVGPRAE